MSLARDVLDTLRRRRWHVATAESCTGGMIAAALTDVPGSSDVVERGFVTYSNAAKAELLGVDPALIAAHGAVSAEVAASMAAGALAHAPVEIAVAVTGVAGPGGGTEAKPVGLVYISVSDAQKTETVERKFPGDRDRIRWYATQQALDMIRRRLM